MKIMKIFNRFLIILGIISFNFSFNISLRAQEYPNRPIKIVIPYPPGGPSDIVGRLLGQALSESLGKSVFIESKPGAAANIGMQYVARSNRNMVKGFYQGLNNCRGTCDHPLFYVSHFFNILK